MESESPHTFGCNAPGLEESLRKQINAQIAAHEAAIIRLKSRQNELSYISRLPPEVLCRVFLAYSKQQESRTPADLKNLAEDSDFPVETAHWTNVTYVCKHWREVGLSCPELWSDITFSSHAWASAMLERSKQVPISLTIDQQRSSPEARLVMFRALSQTSRLKSLIISNARPTFPQTRLKNMTDEATCLETLQLSIRPRLSASPPPKLPTAFLSGGSPRLRRLSLSGIQASWGSPFLQGLVSLKWKLRLEQMHGTPPVMEKSSTADFASALRHMPMLEELGLENTFPTFEALEGNVVPLAHLKKLRLAGTVEECIGALHYIALPPTATLKIRCSFGGGTSGAADYASALLSAIHSSWMSNPLSTPNPLGPFTALAIDDIGGTSYPDLRLFAQPVDFHIGSMERLPAALSITITRGSRVTFSEIASALPLSNIGSIFFGGIPSRRSQDDITIIPFIGLRDLQSIILEDAYALRFIQVLKQDPALRPTEQPENADLNSCTAVTYFPALKSLKLLEVEFVSKTDPDHNRESFGLLDLDDLLDVLMRRYEHGGVIEKLILEKCYELGREGVDRIREVVVDVDWDRFRGEYDADSEDMYYEEST